MTGEYYGTKAYQHYGGTNMARRGTAIADVTNILQSEEITGLEKIPAMTSHRTEPQVITTQELKEYVNEGVQEALESGVNIKTVNNQSLLGSGDIFIESEEDEEMTFNEIDECINF